MSNALNPITEDDIAQYLLNNPQFFERHAQLLSTIMLSGPHGHRAVNLQERQAMMLRDKIRLLESRIMEMIRNGNDNLALSDKLIRWAVELLQLRDMATLPDLIPASVEQQFAVPQVALKVWDVAPQWLEQDFAQGVTQEVRIFADGLTEPFCGINNGLEPAKWLRVPHEAASIALLPLRPISKNSSLTPSQPSSERSLPAMGLMVLASPDTQRFTPTMGTDFLQGLALLSSAALGALQVPA